jgi:hypothetical protein
MIPLSFMEPTTIGQAPYRLAIESIEQMLPGRELGLDVICDGILDGSAFVYRAELLKTEAVASV